MKMAEPNRRLPLYAPVRYLAYCAEVAIPLPPPCTCREPEGRATCAQHSFHTAPPGARR